MQLSQANHWKRLICARRSSPAGVERKEAKVWANMHPRGETKACMMISFSHRNCQSKDEPPDPGWIKTFQMPSSASPNPSCKVPFSKMPTTHKPHGCLPYTVTTLRNIWHISDMWESIAKNRKTVNTGWFFIHPGEICRACVLFLANILLHALSIKLSKRYTGLSILELTLLGAVGGGHAPCTRASWEYVCAVPIK